MSGVRRFLTVRDKSPKPPKDGKHGHHALGRSNENGSGSISSQGTGEPKMKPPDPSAVSDFYALFEFGGKPANHDQEQKIKAIRLRLMDSKGVQIRDSTILWALQSNLADGNDDRAYTFLLAMSDASEGIISPYNPSVRLRGAVNRLGVTCYLDSTLFAIFSRLDSFEAMLYNSFSDLARQKLSFLLRLWVNMLRTGQLVTTDITAKIQKSIAECGWEDAAEMHQQDASEAFTFITGKLELPLLTLKMDIYHAGKEDEADDHKFINERLLEVAIPADPTGQRKDITLEECLEEYFNNRIEVRRYLERRSTMNSIKSPVEPNMKSAAIHVETIEIDEDSSPVTPIGSASMSSSPRLPMRPRQQSIIQDRFTPSQPPSATTSLTNVPTENSTRSRAGSVRKTVMMPGWQFFSLIPWYTDNEVANDAQVAAHFSSKRPVLGLCLKRYSFSNGRPIRLGTYIDIPIEIGLPHFIQDDAVTDNGAIFGNFKLSLQAVVCHRGNSVDSGHYIALVKGTREQNTGSAEDTRQWLRFDDLAPQRITTVDINVALREETAYLLFYQIMPIEEDAAAAARSDTDFSETRGCHSSTSLPLSRVSTTNMVSGRPSFEITGPESPRGRSSVENRRSSVISFSDATLPPSAASTKGHNRSKSRGDSPKRRGSDVGVTLGRTLSKLTKRKSRDISRDPKHETETAEVRVTEVSSLSPSTTEAAPPPKSDALTVKPGLHGHAHGHKRENSRHRHRLSKHGGKQKELDRECAVM